MTLTRKQFEDSVARAHADLLARIPYEYPEIHARYIKMMSEKKDSTTKVAKQAIQRISTEGAAFLLLTVILCPWLFI